MKYIQIKLNKDKQTINLSNFKSKMGSTASIQTIEVSFIDKETGQMLSENEINNLNRKVFNDFNSGFYDCYKDPKQMEKLSNFYNNKTSSYHNQIKIK